MIECALYKRQIVGSDKMNHIFTDHEQVLLKLGNDTNEDVDELQSKLMTPSWSREHEPLEIIEQAKMDSNETPSASIDEQETVPSKEKIVLLIKRRHGHKCDKCDVEFVSRKSIQSHIKKSKHSNIRRTPLIAWQRHQRNTQEMVIDLA